MKHILERFSCIYFLLRPTCSNQADMQYFHIDIKPNQVHSKTEKHMYPLTGSSWGIQNVGDCDYT